MTDEPRCAECGRVSTEWVAYSHLLGAEVCWECNQNLIGEAAITGNNSEGAAAAGAAPGDQVPPFALPLDRFIADKREAPDPLIGSSDDCIVPALGLALLIGKGGKGKTTFCIDLVLHLASGLDYLGLEVPRPLRILFIENEGPREPFRRKLERKRESWPHEIQGGLFIHDENWGHARLDAPEFVAGLNAFCDEHEIDLVVGDPLDSLGMEGEGTPSETRAMVGRFQDAGLFTVRAWLVPHHSRKESVQDAVDEAAGAWGGRPDAMLALEKRKENTARLVFAKVRWQGRERNAYILDFDPEAEGFTFVKEEEGEERDHAVESEEYLRENPLQTSREIGKAIGASREKVEESMRAHPDRFDWVTGEAAKAAGRKPNAVLWVLASAQKPAAPAGGSGERL
jgi:AAA domain